MNAKEQASEAFAVEARRIPGGVAARIAAQNRDRQPGDWMILVPIAAGVEP